MSRASTIKILITLAVCSLLAAACGLLQPDEPGSNGNLAATLSSQGTQLASLATDDAAQWQAIGALSTRMPLALGSLTPMQADITPYPMCTPPACAPDEMFYCPGECPNGCGTTCATATPGISSGFGEVWGETCYPSESIPALTIYFQNVRTLEILSRQAEAGQSSYQVELPAGIYMAWLSDGSISGIYSVAVLCGGGAECTDHSLVPFLVREGSVTTAVDICDYQVEGIALPPLP
jgi:hypothetical protein